MTSNGPGHMFSNSVRAREFEALGLRSRVLEAGCAEAGMERTETSSDREATVVRA
jgi:hypothetical protein